MNKTLIGKEDHLFLINDSCNELNTQCSEVIPNIKIPNHLDLNNYILIVFPNKSLILNQYLPERYKGEI